MPLLSPILVTLALTSSIAQPANSGFAPDHPIRRAPTLLARDISALPKAEAIGSPEVRTLLGYTAAQYIFPTAIRWRSFPQLQRARQLALSH